VEKESKPKQHLKNRNVNIKNPLPKMDPKDLRKAVGTSQAFKTSQVILQQLFTLREIEVFQPNYEHAMNYPQMNKSRMDFSLVNRRLEQCKYGSLFQFLDDCRQVFAFFRQFVG